MTCLRPYPRWTITRKARQVAHPSVTYQRRHQLRIELQRPLVIRKSRREVARLHVERRPIRVRLREVWLELHDAANVIEGRGELASLSVGHRSVV